MPDRPEDHNTPKQNTDNGLSSLVWGALLAVLVIASLLYYSTP